MSIDTPTKVLLLTDFNRVNGTTLSPNDVDIINIEVDGTAGHFDLVPAAGNDMVVESSRCEFTRIDVATLAGKIPTTLPTGAYGNTLDLLPAINKALRVFWVGSDIVSEPVTAKNPGELVSIRCSNENLTHCGLLTFKLSNTSSVLLVGKGRYVQGQVYSMVDNAQPTVNYGSVNIGGIEYALDKSLSFTYTGESGDYDVVANLDTTPTSVFLKTLTHLNRFTVWGGVLKLDKAFNSVSLLTEVGDDVFAGTASVSANMGFNGCTKLKAIGKNFFSVPFSDVVQLFNGCTSLASIGECDITGNHWAPNLTMMFSGCTALGYIPSSALRGWTKAGQAKQMFSQLGANTPGGATLHDDAFVDLNSVKLAEAMFFRSKLASLSSALFSPMVALTDITSLFSLAVIPRYPTGLFSDSPDITHADSLFSNTTNADIEGALFNPGTVLSAKNMFGGAKFAKIAKDIFTGATVTTGEGMFKTASFATTLPNIFVGQSNMTSIENMFAGTIFEFTYETRNLFADCSGVVTMAGLFSGAALTSDVPFGYFDGLINVIDGTSVFDSAYAGAGTAGLPLHVPATVFDKCSKLTTLDRAFISIRDIVLDGSFMPSSKSVKSIKRALSGHKVSPPSNVLEHGESVTAVDYLFSGTALSVVDNALIGTLKSVTELPNVFDTRSTYTVKADAFIGLDKIESLSYAFGSYDTGTTTKLTLEEGVFDNLPKLKSVSLMFSKVLGVTIPKNLFANNPLLVDASSLFSNATLNGPVVDLFGPTPTQKNLAVTGLFFGANLNNAIGVGTKANIPLANNARSLFKYSNNNPVDADTLLDWLGVSADNHLDVTADNKEMFTFTGWVTGNKDSLVQRLWGVDDSNSVPTETVDVTLSGIKFI